MGWVIVIFIIYLMVFSGGSDTKNTTSKTSNNQPRQEDKTTQNVSKSNNGADTDRTNRGKGQPEERAKPKHNTIEGLTSKLTEKQKIEQDNLERIKRNQ